MPATAKPRLAYLYSRYPVVSQTFCDSEMLALEEMGFEIEVGSLNRPPNSFRHERLDRLQAELHYPFPPELLKALENTAEYRETLLPLVEDHRQRYGAEFKPDVRARNALGMALRFRRLGVQHVHIHFANRATHSALFLKKLGFSFSFTAHAQDFMQDLGSEELLAEMAREAEFVVAVSDFTRDLLRRSCPDSADKIQRIYNGIEVTDFPKAAVKVGEVLRLVSIGRLIEFKGFQHLIAACRLLKDQGIDFKSHIIGDGPLREELQSRIDQYGLGDRVKLLGVRSQEEIKAELAAADLFVLPSIVDSKGACDILPTVITEAMACHLPVVSTTVTGIPEMVVPEETGLLVEPKDEKALADAVVRLAGDSTLRERMGRAGRRRAERLFTFQSTAHTLGGRFQSVSRPPDAPRAETPITYLLPQWDGTSLHGMGAKEGVRWLTMTASWPTRDAHPAALHEMETLPDASVLESLWLRRGEARQILEGCRSELGGSLPGTVFYQSAKQAILLADILPKRGTRHLHARGAGSVLTTWLTGKLLPDLQISAAVEEEPTLSRSLLQRLLPSFVAVSLSDPKLLDRMEGVDLLQLRLPPRSKETRVGPISFSRSSPSEEIDRPTLEHDYLALLRRSLSHA